MIKTIRQICRGCTTLPHVGPHPGTPTLLIFQLLGALAGLDRGIDHVIVSLLFVNLFVLPLHLWGAYERAEESDRLVSYE